MVMAGSDVSVVIIPGWVGGNATLILVQVIHDLEKCSAGLTGFGTRGN